jgi:hypothetical protein
MSLRPEERLVLLLSRGTLRGREEPEARQLLAGRLRWDLIVDIAEREAVYPLFYWNLGRVGASRVPMEIHESLDRRYKANALRNAVMVRELEDVLALFSGAGIPAVPLKGVFLAGTLYGNRGLRVCLDMDVLVPIGEVGKAVRLLRGHQYTSEFPEDDFFEGLLLSQDIEHHLRKPGPISDQWLELHWALLWGPRWDEAALEDLWLSVKPRSDLGVAAYGLSREWEFLYLSAHAARHRWRGLKWLADIHELSSSTDIDWAQVKSKAEAVGWSRVVDVSLAVCRSLFGSQVPPPFSVGPPPKWVACFPNHPSGSTAAPDALAFMRLLEQPWKKLSYLFGVIFIPTLAERRVLRLPAALGLLYYVIRPFRLAAKWGLHLLRSVSERDRSR